MVAQSCQRVNNTGSVDGGDLVEEISLYKMWGVKKSPFLMRVEPSTLALWPSKLFPFCKK